MRLHIASSLVVLSTLFLASCGGDSGSSSSGGGSNVEVKNVRWSMSNPVAGPYCQDPDTVNEFSGSYSATKSCIWTCANYKGSSKRYVSIRFRKLNKPGEVWKYDGDYVSSGICY